MNAHNEQTACPFLKEVVMIYCDACPQHKLLPRNQVVSMDRWMKIAREVNVDVLVANHPLHDRGIENNELLRYRLPGDSNPYVIGTSRYVRYMGVQQECARVQLARLGETG